MSHARDASPDVEPTPSATEASVAEAPSQEGEPEDVAAILESVAPQPDDEAREPVAVRLPSLATGTIVRLLDRRAEVKLRGREKPTLAHVDEEVDLHLLREATDRGDLCLLEQAIDGELVVVGVVQRRRPSRVELSGDTVTIEAAREVLLRTGTAALRLRQDGDVELVGTRISAASRGLFKLVGRMLRLN